MTRRPAYWLVALCATLPFLGFYAPGDAIATVTYAVCAALAVVALWVGVGRQHGPEHRSWVLLAAGVTAWVVGDLVGNASDLLGRDEPAFSTADLAYLAGYALLLAGIVRLARRRSPALVREGLLDALALGFGTTIAVWLFLVEPHLDRMSSPGETFVAAAYPFGDVMLVAAVAWLMLSAAQRGAPTYFVLGFVILNLGLDVAEAGIPLWAPSWDTEVLGVVFPLCYALLAAAALHPNASELAQEGAASTRLHPARIALLGLALVSGPVIVCAHTNLAAADRVVALASAIAIAAVVLLRFTMAVRDGESVHAELEHRAAHDELTGLVNRVLLLDRIEHALDRTTRSGARVGVLYLDLDRFKPVNDTWGHRSGDRVLEVVADRLRASVRPGDTVARVGGDEFVVLCDEVADPGEVIAVAERIVVAIGDSITLDNAIVCVTASVGIALATGPGDDRTADEVLRDADAAMYRAKERGRDRWELYDAEIRDEVARRRDTESALQRAVVNDELRLMYQPIVRLASGTVSGFEALVRWSRPGDGLVMPDQFIALAEETGLIIPIGEWVLQTACRQLAEWNGRNPHRPPLEVSVNVSGRQLNHPGFAASVERVLHETGADPRHLTLEVTETVLVRERDHAIGTLDDLKRIGVRIAVDDFGTGYSALAYLRRFAIDVVKIDRVFMEELGHRTPDTTVVAAVIRLAQVLGHQVVAEGAETADQMAALYGLGCDYVQGFYFAPALARQQADVLVDSARSVAAVRDALQRA